MQIDDRSNMERGARVRARETERGFTLVETSVAMVVMMVVGLAAASLFTFAVGYNTNATDRELATILAQQRIERMRAIPFDATTRNLAFASGGLGATATTGVVENVQSGGRRFSVTTVIENVAFDTAATPQPVLKRITVRVAPTGAGGLAIGGVRVTTLRATIVKGTY